MSRMIALRLTLAGLPLLGGRALLPSVLLALLSMTSLAAFAVTSPDPLPLRLPEAPTVLAVSPATHRLYVALWPDDAVYALDGASYRVIGGVPLVGAPAALVVDPATEHVYAAVPNGVAVIAGSTMTLLTTVTLGAWPTALAVDPSTHRLYVAVQRVGERRTHDVLVVIDGFDDTVVAELPVGLGPTGVAVDPGSQRVYVANSVSSAVSVLDGRSGAALAAIPAGRSPWAVALDPARRRLYVSDASDGKVIVIDTTKEAVVTEIPVGGWPGRLAVDAAHRVCVSVDNGVLAMVNADSGAVQATLTLGRGIRDVAVDPTTGTTYATAFDSGAFWAIRHRRFGAPSAHLIARASVAAEPPDDGAEPPER